VAGQKEKDGEESMGPELWQDELKDGLLARTQAGGALVHHT